MVPLWAATLARGAVARPGSSGHGRRHRAARCISCWLRSLIGFRSFPRVFTGLRRCRVNKVSNTRAAHACCRKAPRRRPDLRVSLAFYWLSAGASPSGFVSVGPNYFRRPPRRGIWGVAGVRLGEHGAKIEPSPTQPALHLETQK